MRSFDTILDFHFLELPNDEALAKIVELRASREAAIAAQASAIRQAKAKAPNKKLKIPIISADGKTITFGSQPSAKTETKSKSPTQRRGRKSTNQMILELSEQLGLTITPEIRAKLETKPRKRKTKS